MSLKQKGFLKLYVNLEKLTKQEGLYYDPLALQQWKLEIQGHGAKGRNSAVSSFKARKASFHSYYH